MSLDIKKCIWCNKGEPSVTFNKDAHTIPQSLGGLFTTKNVCDDCNHYFGSRKFNKIAIEVALREAFEITRYIVFSTLNKMGKNKKYKRFKSEFFNVNYNTKQMNLKQKYSLRRGFQENIGRQFRKGIYKIFLEEYHRQFNDGFNSNFDFIREFARFDLNDLPVLYCIPKVKAIFFAESEFNEPKLTFIDRHLEIMNLYGFYEFRLFSHSFLIATKRHYDLNIDSFFAKSKSDFEKIYSKIILVNHFSDLDLFCKYKN